jgi:DNA polymerase-3 subunit alpha
MAFCPLVNHTHYSLLDAIAKPDALAKRAANFGYSAVAMTDHGNLGAAVEFVSAMRAAKLKPLLGCEFNLCRDDPTIKTSDNGRPYSHVVLLAKNLAGWKQLIGAVSRSSNREHSYQGPRLSLESLADFTVGHNLIAMSGHMGSDLANALFVDPKVAYQSASLDEVRKLVHPDWSKRLSAIVEQYISIFGKENFFIQTQVVDPDVIPASKAVAITMRVIAKRFGIPCVATPDVHYPESMDADDQRVVLCSHMKTTLNAALNRGKAFLQPDLTMGNFFRSSAFYLPSEEELLENHPKEELEQSVRIADMCEDYDILHSPMLPHFPCPDGMNADTYLKELCDQGWRDKVQGRLLSEPIEVYEQRLKMELDVIKGVGLSAYFLIVQDFMNYGRRKGWILGPGRGSGAGCIISWLTGITGVDPIKYGLIFERFYNEGRVSNGVASLPDIDSDIPKEKADEIFAYLGTMYGEDYVAKIATFNSMQGRSALTEVMRAHEEDHELIKRITKTLPDKARISEELEEMRKAGGEPSIIAYSLDVLADDLSDWARAEFDDDGRIKSISGEYGARFAQAIRLEGVKKHIGTHAAGVLIGAEPLHTFVPLKWDETSKSNIAAMEMNSVEKMGGCKIDVLRVAFLDKAMAYRSLALTGRIDHDAA